MAALSEQVQARLRALADTFSSQLPQRMGEIASDAQKCLADSTDRGMVQGLRNNVHKLAGSAATFGFHHVTVCAKRLEHILDDALQDPTPWDDKFQRSVRMLISELAEATRQKDRDSDVEVLEEIMEADEAVADALSETPTQVAVAESGGNPRMVVILVPVGDVQETLIAQIKFFGFDYRVLTSAVELESLQGDNCHIALIVDVSIIADDPSASELLVDFQEKRLGWVHPLFISDTDDFSTRLLAVRAGGTGFFTSPIDSHRIVESVDGLTSGGSGAPYHVMIVDDDVEQVSHHAMILQGAGMITSVVSDPENVFSVMIESKPELILMDMYMPGCSGPELATIIRQQEAFVGIPIVFLSIETDEDKQIQAVSKGGDGFLSKPIRPEHLITAVANRVERTRSMRFYMERDSLTGLLNHTHLIQSLSKEVQRGERVGRPICFAMIDVDHFKNVNDTYGHLTGDRVLKSLARYLQDRLRKTDVVGRYGGEEFGVVLFNVDIENARRIMDNIREEFSHIEHEAGETRFVVTFSCGIAPYPEYDGPGPISEAADAALFTAKELGRNQVVVV